MYKQQLMIVDINVIVHNNVLLNIDSPNISSAVFYKLAYSLYCICTPKLVSVEHWSLKTSLGDVISNSTNSQCWDPITMHSKHYREERKDTFKMKPVITYYPCLHEPKSLSKLTL